MIRSDFLGGMLGFVLTPIAPTNQSPSSSSIPPPFGLNLPTVQTNQSTVQLALGVVGPMTGPLSAIGMQMQNGVHSAVDEANQIRGPLDPTYTVRPFDDHNDELEAELTANFATNDGTVIATVGHFGGKATTRAVPVYSRSQCVLVVPATTADSVTAHGYLNVFRLPTRDGIEGDLTAQDLIKRHGTMKLAIVTKDKASYGPDVVRGFLDRMRVDNHPIVQTVLPADHTDPSPMFNALVATQPQVVYFAGTLDDLGAFFAAVRSRLPNALIFASQGFFDPAVSSRYGALGDGITVATSIPPAGQSAANAQIVADYSSSYGNFTPVAAFSYAAAQIIVSASRRTGAQNRAALLHALSDGTSYQTVCGDFRFTPFGDQADPNIYFYETRKGGWRYVRSFKPSSFALS